MTWRMKTRKSETRGRQKTERALQMQCLILTFCIPDGRDVVLHTDIFKYTNTTNLLWSIQDKLALIASGIGMMLDTIL